MDAAAIPTHLLPCGRPVLRRDGRMATAGPILRGVPDLVLVGIAALVIAAVWGLVGAWRYRRNQRARK